MKSIKGYLRANGEYGIRNHLLIIPTVICANQVSNRISQLVAGTVAIPHQHGCSQIGADKERTFNTLAGTGRNPNVGAVIVVSLGCEVIDPYELADAIRVSGKPVEVIDIQSCGGSIKAIQQGSEIAKRLRAELDLQQKVEMPISKLRIGVKCGGSDATSGMASNPALGVASDLLIAEGGTVVISETTEIIGAEHVMAARCSSPEIGQQLYTLLSALRKRSIVWVQICAAAIQVQGI